MGDLISIESVKDRLVTVRGELALLDRDVAAFYGVETKRVNEAVKNNPKKFPPDYMFSLSPDEVDVLRPKISTTKISPKSRVLPKAFTEKGLYMLATILKSHLAVEASFAIIETFAKVRTIKRELVELHTETNKRKKASLMKHFGEALTDIVMPDLGTTETESSLELNFFIGKIKHTVRRVRKAGAGERR